jgi:2-keto-4-pentenoate hydratase
MALVEPEIGFVVARDVPPHFPDNDVVDCIGEVRLVLELIESRYSDPGMASFPELVADNLSNQGLFVGPVVSTLPSDLPGSFLLQVSTSQGVILERECRHPDGHPLRTLRSLMQSLAETGETLLQGQVLITGSFAGVLQFQAGEPICIRFGNLGELCVEFHEAAYPGICNLST